jgi:hypothetical protein
MNESNDEEWLPSEKNVEDYRLHSKMLASLASEVRELSKKKQDGVLNLTKVKMINRVLKPLHDEVFAEIPTASFLDLLDEDDLPNNSDAVLIISQYEAAIKEFRDLYFRRYQDQHTHSWVDYWATQEKPFGVTEEEEDEDDDQ